MRTGELKADETAQLLEGLYATAPLGLCYLDRDLRFVRVNEQMARIDGLPAEDHVGRRLDEVLRKPEEAVAAACRVLETGRSVSGLELLRPSRHEPARIEHLVWTFHPVRAEDGRVDGVGIQVVDLSAQAWAAEDRARLAETVEAAADAIVGTLSDGTITTWNPAAERLFGWSSGEALGQNSRMLLPDDTNLAEQETIGGIIRAGERHGPIATRRRHRDGHILDVALTVAPIRDEDGAVVGAVAVFRDVSRQRHEADLLRRLVAVGDALSAEVDRERVADIVVRESVEALGAPVAGFFLVEGDRLRVLRHHGVPDDLMRALESLPLDTPGWAAGDVARRGHAVVFETEAERLAAYPEAPSVPVRSGLRGALVHVPVLAADRVLGVIGLRFDRDRRFSDAERGFLQGFAHQVALALQRVAAFEAESLSRDEAERAAARAARLLAVTDALGGAFERDDIARVIVREAMAAFGASAGALSVVVEQGRMLEVAAAVGLEGTGVGRWQRQPIDADGPIADALRAGEDRHYPSAAVLTAAFPDVGEPFRSRFEAELILPLRHEGRVLGGLVLSFDAPRDLSDEERQLARAIALQCAQALDRARLLENERASGVRADFLAAAAEALGSALDHRATVRDVADRAVPAIADWCIVVLTHEPDGRETVVAAHADPEKAWLAEALESGTAPRDARWNPYVPVEDEPWLLMDVPDALLVDHAASPEHLAHLRAFEARSAIGVPLVSHDRELGSLTLMTAGSERRYGTEDLALAVELARRTAAAIENTRLYVDLRRANERAEFLARASAALGESLDRDRLLRRLAELAVPVIADWCFVNLPDADGRLRNVIAVGDGPDATVLAERGLGEPIEDPAYAAGRLVLRERIEADDLRAMAGGDLERLADIEALRPSAAITVPIRGRGASVGSLSLIVSGDRTYDREDVDLAHELAWRAAVAIENADLFREVMRARERAELLGAASERLSRPLDDATLRDVARLTVPAVADSCFVDLLDPDGEPVRAATAHADPAGADPAALTSMRTAGASGALDGTVFEPTVTDGRLRALAVDDEHLAMLRALGLRSYVATPIVGRAGPLGSLSMITAGSGRTLRPDDVALAEDLARRMAPAIETARLHEDLRAAAHSERERAGQLEAVLHAVGEAIVVFDRDGRVSLANQTATAVFGGDLPATYSGLRARFADPERLPDPSTADRGLVEARLRGSDRWLEVARYAVDVGGRDDADRLASAIVVLRDVTDLRRAQQLRDAFIGVLSHELRTPITTIYGGSRVLSRDGIDEVMRREVAEDVVAEAERLHRLVEDLLVLARAERGAMDIGGDPVLLQHVIPRVLRSETGRWPGVRIDLRMPPTLPTVAADDTYIEQVVRNLVGNAAKYAGPGSGVEIEAEATDDEVIVRVLDDGPGFPPEAGEQLFELFYRAPDATGKSGAGIGLFVCRALVEAMGGRIWAVPRPAGGAEFGFTLPVLHDEA